MPERTVQLGSMFYYDEDGRGRRAEAGEKIKVSSDFVKKFDELNVLASEDDLDVKVVPPVAPEAVEAEERDVPKPGPRKKSE